MKRLSLLASTIALILSGCGSDSSDNSPQTPPSSSFEINSTASTTATEDIQYQYQLSTINKPLRIRGLLCNQYTCWYDFEQ
ncbi:hypothetical protein CWO01_15280 [Vibrio splendidus]|uniref:hypothetical protein n=1 Tax=Vibrio splendidus TaxID=29497 RepID=UPI000D378A0D|nr:hypothetical protein [Vibrio splendidus]PTP61004.1 hypothetical protein CWO01_15280 [Vibrio splendidus]